MNNLKKSQVLMLSLLTILLIIAPLLSSSQRPTYIYFVTNLLIIALGAEAGLLSSFSNPSSSSSLDTNDKKNPPSFVPQKPSIIDQSHHNDTNGSEQDPKAGHGARVVEKCLSEKIVGSVKVEKVKKCPSMPSLFFIGDNNISNNDSNIINYFEDYDEEDEEEQEEEEVSGQELYAKAESFIGNFYKQLKMQREDSWKRIHGFIKGSSKTNMS